MPTKLPQAWLSSDACGGLRLRMMTNFEFPAMTPSPNPSLVNCDVIIVGGGISGLTLACGLQSSGLQILVEAQQEQQATERSLGQKLTKIVPSSVKCQNLVSLNPQNTTTSILENLGFIPGCLGFAAYSIHEFSKR
ncbi:FAD-binding protein [Nostoc sp.]|uniref:FAD-binding protein n=1 Tax=Nostoc sp. TaxID=1180 RepID=UPI002FF8011D